MENLIKHINESTGYRVELVYDVYPDREGYKANFFADDEYKMDEVFENPLDALKKLARDNNIIINE